MIDSRPLWPPGLPLCRIRNRPSRNEKSSSTTKISCGAILKNWAIAKADGRSGSCSSQACQDASPSFAVAASHLLDFSQTVRRFMRREDRQHETDVVASMRVFGAGICPGLPTNESAFSSTTREVEKCRIVPVRLGPISSALFLGRGSRRTFRRWSTFPAGPGAAASPSSFFSLIHFGFQQPAPSASATHRLFFNHGATTENAVRSGCTFTVTSARQFNIPNMNRIANV